MAMLQEYRESTPRGGAELWNERKALATNRTSTLSYRTSPRIEVKDEVLSEPALTPALVATLARPQRLGQRLRQERLARGLSLNQIEHECKIRWEFLQAIEQENFSYVPRQQLRVALHTYATYLGLDLHTFIERPPAPKQSFISLYLVTLMVIIALLLIVALYLLHVR
jgi:hypothetical protein